MCRSIWERGLETRAKAETAYNASAMTLATPHPGKRSVPSAGEVFAAGSSIGRRRVWVLAGFALLVLAYGTWLMGALSPQLRDFTDPSALLLAAVGLLVVSVAVWRRARGFQVRGDGIVLANGGPIFGDKQLVPWGSITQFRGRRSGPDQVCLTFRQQHIGGDLTLPGRPMSVHEYDRLIDRLRVVLGNRYAQLELGGLEE